MPWYRTDDGQGVFHACIRGAAPIACQAPRLEGDNPAHGERCGRSGGKLCDGPRGPYSQLGSATCDMSICSRHATHVEGEDLDYCPDHYHLAAPAAAIDGTPKVERHRWVKLRIHVYICRKCGTGKVNAQRGGEWQTTYHCPEGTTITSAKVPPCEVGPLTKKYLATYSDAIAAAAPQELQS